jgi:aspartyl-tRNA(Asn)/glutamyl-tRNA(Gln) amidotransferase subunit B
VSGQWEVVIGLEIHAQLATQSKIFSGASTAYGAEPNTQACLVDLGYPGVLPVLERGAVVRMATAFGLAVNATVRDGQCLRARTTSIPDLPKGYQISQYELPIVEHGGSLIDLEDGSHKRIGITRAHLEEDAGKSIHEGLSGSTGIDLNRAGTPLLEIVRNPIFAPRKRPWPTCARYTRSCATSASLTATCRKARFAATPTCRCGRRARRSLAPAPRSRT